MVCGHEKTYCRICQANNNGFCTRENKQVMELYDAWRKRRVRKVEKKLRENSENFNYGEVKEICNKVHDDRINIETHYGIEQMNKLKTLMEDWKYIDIEYLTDFAFR